MLHPDVDGVKKQGRAHVRSGRGQAHIGLQYHGGYSLHTGCDAWYSYRSRLGSACLSQLTRSRHSCYVNRSSL